MILVVSKYLFGMNVIGKLVNSTVSPPVFSLIADWVKKYSHREHSNKK
jgi:hypothetical protein